MTQRVRGCLLEAVETLVLTLIIFLVIQTFIAQPYQVEQQSMENTLLPNQYVLVDKLTPRFDGYQRGDIVVFTPPGQPAGTTPYIKRVIGLPGDIVDLRNGHVVINGQEISEPYVYPGQTTEPLSGQDHWVVPQGTLFVLGDHRENSTDSRVFGPVPLKNVIGRAWLRYWPLGDFEVIATPTYPDLSPLLLPSIPPSGLVHGGANLPGGADPGSGANLPGGAAGGSGAAASATRTGRLLSPVSALPAGLSDSASPASFPERDPAPAASRRAALARAA
ncbi:MAG: signal peptidase I [Candidatus Limnocylindrales bacterium]